MTAYIDQLPPHDTFYDLTLRQAEEQLVAAAIDHRHALATLLAHFRHGTLRSEVALDLEDVVAALARWLLDGTYNDDTNRERLEELETDPLERAVWAAYIESLWCPWGVIPEYVAALVGAIETHYRLYDARVSAAVAWRDDNPLAVAGATQLMNRQPVPPPVNADWEDIRQRVHR